MAEFKIESLSTTIRSIQRRASSLKHRPTHEKSSDKSLPYLAGRLRKVETPKGHDRSYSTPQKHNLFDRPRSGARGSTSAAMQDLRISFENLGKNRTVDQRSSSFDRIANRLGKTDANMNVYDEYSTDRSVDKKMCSLIGPYKYSNRFKGYIKKVHESFDEPRDKFLDPPPNKKLNFASDLQMLIKQKLKIKNADARTNVVSILKELKERSDALQKDEPMLDCFIKMKKEGHFNRENPMEVVNPPVYFREVRDHPVHKLAKGGYKRNRFGIPFLWN